MATFLEDLFTDTDGVLLQNHTPGIGAAPVPLGFRLDGTTDGITTDADILGNKAKSDVDTAASRAYRYPTAPASADYSAVGVFVINQANSSSHSWLLAVRASDTGTTNAAVDRYIGGYVGNSATGSRRWFIAKVVNGVLTELGSFAENLHTANVIRECELEANGTAIKLYVDGVERVSVVDSAITQVGRICATFPRPNATLVNFFDALSGVDAAAGDIILDIGRAIETDIAQPFTVTQSQVVVLNRAIEADVAQPLAVVQSQEVVLNRAIETDLAQPLTVVGPVTIVLNRAIETDIARPLTVVMSRMKIDVARFFPHAVDEAEAISGLAFKPKGLDDVALDRLILRGEKLKAVINQPILDASLDRTMQGPSTISITVHDPERKLIRSKLVNERSYIHLDGMGFAYAGYIKSGENLDLLFEDIVVDDLKRLKPGTARQKHPLASKRGIQSRTAFARRLVSLLSYVKFRGDPGDPFLKAFTQGKKESAWHTLVTLAEDRSWRCFVAEEIVFFGSDEWLAGLKAPLSISEDDDGIDYIDPSYDGGKRATTCTVTCYARRWAARPGLPIRVKGLGDMAGKGVWLVETISRSLFSQLATVTLVRKTPELPEPMPEATGASGGYVASGSIVTVGKQIERLRGGCFDCSEHPKFGGVSGGHAKGGEHYQNDTGTGGDAIDINWRGGGGFSSEPEALAWLFEEWIPENVTGVIEAYYPGNDPKGHGDHGHLALDATGGLLVAAPAGSQGQGAVKEQLKAGYASVGRRDLVKLVDHPDFDTWTGAETAGTFDPMIVSPANNNGKVNGGYFQFWAGHAWAVRYFTKGVRIPGSQGNRFTMPVAEQAIATVRHFGLTVAEVHRYAAQIRSGSYGGWG